MDVDFTPYTQAHWERNCQLAAAVLIVYEYFIQLGNEIDYFWKQRWSLAKVLFLWSRYYSMAYNVGNAVVFLQSQATQGLCTKFFYWQNFGSAVQHLTTQVILQLRLYAMYGLSKKILAFFFTLTICEIVVMGVLFGLHRDGLVSTNNPLPGLFICADADPPHGHWIAYMPTTVLIMETIFLALALNRAWEDRRDGAGGKLMTWLTKESVSFFISIFLIHLANQIIWMVNKITVNELLTGFSFVIPAILANRLLISIRMYNAQPDTLSNLVTTQGMMKFSGRIHLKHNATTFEGAPPHNTIEMTSFGGRSENM